MSPKKAHFALRKPGAKAKAIDAFVRGEDLDETPRSPDVQPDSGVQSTSPPPEVQASERLDPSPEVQASERLDPPSPSKDVRGPEHWDGQPPGMPAVSASDARVVGALDARVAEPLNVQAPRTPEVSTSGGPDVRETERLGVQEPEGLDAQALGDLDARALGGLGSSTLDVREFGVQGAQPPGRPAAQDPPRGRRRVGGKGLVRRQSGKVRRRRTIYLPPDVDRALATFCASQEREVSEVVAELVSSFLRRFGQT